MLTYGNIETKALFIQAADLEGRALTDFVVSTVRAEARRVIEQHQTLEDSQDLVAALLDPPQPNKALKAAVLRHPQVLSKE